MPTESYDYRLPPELIAHTPAEPRDAARLLVYRVATDEVVLDTFANLAKYLPEQATLVLNDTAVVPARLTLYKPTGGAVKILFLFNEWDGGDEIRGLPDRGLKPGDKLSFESGGEIVVEVLSHQAEEFVFKLQVSAQRFREIAEEYGSTPLPPYIHAEMSEAVVRERYQTTFAAVPASVAAPTASLHFTARVFQTLADKKISRVPVTLHVGRGTFSPVTPEMIATGSLHAEPFSVSADSAAALSSAKQANRPIIAAGTTALRVLESAADKILHGQAIQGTTKLFIKPPYHFQLTDGLITNFHLPGTSLLTLVDALLQARGAKRSWRDLYEVAIGEGFRFYSFGDAMLIL